MSKAIAAVLPWAPRHERHAAIDAARQEKVQSQAAAAASRKVRQQINRLAQQNNFAQHLRQTLRDDQ